MIAKQKGNSLEYGWCLFSLVQFTIYERRRTFSRKIYESYPWILRRII